MPDGSTYIQLHEPSAVDPVNDTFPHISEPGTAFYHKPADALFIRCANNSLLSVKALKQQNSKLVPAKAFWNGVRPAWCGEVEGHGKKWKVVRFHEPGTV
jgi:methionyl-tRNA formyltransferase